MLIVVPIVGLSFNLAYHLQKFFEHIVLTKNIYIIYESERLTFHHI